MHTRCFWLVLTIWSSYNSVKALLHLYIYETYWTQLWSWKMIIHPASPRALSFSRSQLRSIISILHSHGALTNTALRPWLPDALGTAISYYSDLVLGPALHWKPQAPECSAHHPPNCHFWEEDWHIWDLHSSPQIVSTFLQLHNLFAAIQRAIRNWIVHTQGISCHHTMCVYPLNQIP